MAAASVAAATREQNIAAVTAGAAGFVDLAAPFAELGLLPLSAPFSCVASFPVLPLAAVRELLQAWERTRRKVAAQWTAAASRFRRLLLFVPREDDKSYTCYKERAQARSVLNAKAERKENEEEGAFSQHGGRDDATELRKNFAAAARANDAPAARADDVPAARADDAPAAKGGGAAAAAALETSRVACSWSAEEPTTFYSLRTRNGVVLLQERVVKNLFFQKRNRAAALSESFVPSTCRESVSASCSREVAFPSSYEKAAPCGDALSLLGAYEEMLQQKRTAALLPTWDPHARAQLQRREERIYQAVLRAQQQVEAYQEGEADWGSCALPGMSDSFVICHQHRRDAALLTGAAAAAAQGRGKYTTQAAKADTPVATSALSYAQVSSPAPLTESLHIHIAAGGAVAVGGAAAKGGTTAAEARAAAAVGGAAAADEADAHCTQAFRGKASAVAASSCLVSGEIYTQPLTTAAAVMEVEGVIACAAATAEALRASPPAPPKKADAGVHVLSIMAEVDDSLTLMQQQQVDCIRSLYRRVQHQLVNCFLKHAQRVVFTQGCNAASSFELFCCCGKGGDSCTGVTAAEHPDTSAAAGTSRLELLLGLRLTCEALLQKRCTACASLRCTESYLQHLKDEVAAATAIAAAATAKAAAGTAGAAAEAARSSNAFAAAGRRRKNSTAKERRGCLPSSSSFSSCDDNLTGSHQLGDVQNATARGSPVTAATPAEAFSAHVETAIWGLSKTSAQGKFNEEVPGVVDGDTRLLSTLEHSGEAGQKLCLKPGALPHAGMRNSEACTQTLAPTLRRAALLHVKAASVQILMSCSKLLQVLQYAEQAIQRVLSGQIDAGCSGEDTDTETRTREILSYDYQLSVFLQPLELPSAAAAIRAVKHLQETSWRMT